LLEGRIEFKLIKIVNGQIHWEILPFSGNHFMVLKGETQMEVFIKEGQEVVTLKPSHKSKPKLGPKKKKTIDMDDENKFKRNVDLTGEEHIVVMTINMPIDVIRDENGKWTTNLNNNMMYPALYSYLQSKYKHFKWVSYFEFPKDTTEKDKEEIESMLNEKSFFPVYLDPRTYLKFMEYYEKVLYPFFHNFVCPSDNFEFMETEYWDAYNYVNKKFAEAAIECGDSNSLFWVHDMYLLMCPFLIIRKNVNANIGLFIHSSFPSGEVYKIFPYREEILASILCCNIVGFHVFSYARNFIIACRRILGISHQTA